MNDLIFEDFEPNITLGEVYNIWFETFRKPRIKEVTQYSYKLVYNKHIKPVFGSIPVCQIKAFHLQKYFNELMKYSLRKCEDVKNILNGVFEFSFYNDIIRRNPMKFIFVKKHYRLNGVPLTSDEQSQLLNSLPNNNYKTAIMIYLYTGCRPTELCSIKFDFSNEVFIIKNSKLKEYQLNLTRTLPIFPTLYKIKSLIIKNDWRIKYDLISRYFSDYCPSHTLKDLRHTFSTKAKSQGISEDLIDFWLGHTGKTLASRTYIHFEINFQKVESLKITY